MGDYSKPDGIQTHFIHVVRTIGRVWRDYINFRNYPNAKHSVAKAYEALKIRLAMENPHDHGREKYLAGKHGSISDTLGQALTWNYLGKIVTVAIDRPAGSVHPKHTDIFYPVNYGYIVGEIAPDGEELDVYVLGATEPLETFTGTIVAIIHCEDDVEDKLVAAPADMVFTADEIAKTVRFQEQYFKIHIELYEENTL